MWLRGQDSNLRPSGYEPDELPDCSTPRYDGLFFLAIPPEFPTFSQSKELIYNTKYPAICQLFFRVFSKKGQKFF